MAKPFPDALYNSSRRESKLFDGSMVKKERSFGWELSHAILYFNPHFEGNFWSFVESWALDWGFLREWSQASAHQLRVSITENDSTHVFSLLSWRSALRLGACERWECNEISLRQTVRRGRWNLFLRFRIDCASIPRVWLCQVIRGQRLQNETILKEIRFSFVDQGAHCFKEMFISISECDGAADVDWSWT